MPSTSLYQVYIKVLTMLTLTPRVKREPVVGSLFAGLCWATVINLATARYHRATIWMDWGLRDVWAIGGPRHRG